MVGLFPLDLRSELKQRVGGGKPGFALKKSSTHVEVSGGENLLRKQEVARSSVPIPIKNDLMRNLMKKKSEDSDDDEDAGVENLSFKEKLQLIERSSSRSLVNPL